MATTRDYFDYLTAGMDIAPANSQEELQAAEALREIMDAHGVDARIQEFDAPAWGGLVYRVVMVVLFLGIFLAGMQGTPLALVGIVLTVVCFSVFLARYLGTDTIGNVGPRARSQNVVAVHRATGPLADKANRPVVVVAHYDTPRDNFLHLPQMASFRPPIGRLSPILILVVGVCGLAQALVFLPDALRRVVWIVGILASLPLLVLGIASIQERFAPCTDGANDNKASVAALLGVLAAIRPARDAADEFALQSAPADAGAQAPESVGEEARTAPAEVTVQRREDVVGVRHGREVLASLQILPATCEIVYREPRLVSVVVPAGEAPAASAAPSPGIVPEEGEAAGDETHAPTDDLAARGASVARGVTQRGRALIGRLGNRLGRGNAGVAEVPRGDSEYDMLGGTGAPANHDGDGIAAGVTFSSEGDPSDSEAAHRDDSGLGTMGDVMEAPARGAARTPRPPEVAERNWGTSDLAPEQTGGFARRAVLFDLPDPSASSSDPFATDPTRPPLAANDAGPSQGGDETTATLNTSTAPRPVQMTGSMPLLRPLDTEWKGGATRRSDLRVVGEEDERPEEQREAVLGMDDDALVAHDVWFVALGASTLGHAGMGAFLDEYRSQIRGAFVINLSCVGAGTRTLLTREGIDNPRRADRRLERLIGSVAADLHLDLDKRALDWDVTDATTAMRSSVRSMTVMGMSDAGTPALSRTPDDVAENVDPSAIVDVTDLVCEVIRRS